MTAAALVLLAGAFLVTVWAYLDARQEARANEAAYLAEAEDHERTREQLAKARRDLQVTEALLVAAGREAATHADHLTAVMDAMAEGKPLTLVRGGRA